MAGERYAQLRITTVTPLPGDAVDLWLGGTYRRFTARNVAPGSPAEAALPVGEFAVVPYLTQSYEDNGPQRQANGGRFAAAVVRLIFSLGLGNAYTVTTDIVPGSSGAALVTTTIQATVYDAQYDFAPTRHPAYPPGTDPTLVNEYIESARLATVKPLFVTVSASMATCFGSATGSIALSVSGGNTGTYAYRWADGPTTAGRAALVASTYTVTVRDSGASETIAVAITQNSRIEVAINKVSNDLRLAVSGGVPGYTYAWSDGPTTADRRNVASGTYTVTVTDAVGCTRTATVTVERFRYYYSGNPIPLALDAGDDYRANPASKPRLSFVCEVWLEQSYRSNVFARVGPVLEQPADSRGRTTFDVQALLQAYVQPYWPAPGLATAVRADGLFKRFYLKYYERTSTGPGPVTVTDQSYLLRGGLSFVEAGTGTFFSGYQDTKLPFLSWEPATKRVLADQPEYLFALVPRATMIHLQQQLRLHFTDGTTRTLLRANLYDVRRYEVYCLPCGYSQLDLGQYTAGGKQIARWDIQVLDQAGVPASEVRTYVLSRQPAPARRYFLYLNSLGGLNTLACRGRAEQQLATKTLSTERPAAAGYNPALGSVAVQLRTGVPSLKCYTGPRSAAQLAADADFFLADQVRLLRSGRLLAGVVKDATLTTADEDETRRTLAFTFELPREQFYTPDL